MLLYVQLLRALGYSRELAYFTMITATCEILRQVVDFMGHEVPCAAEQLMLQI